MDPNKIVEEQARIKAIARIKVINGETHVFGRTIYQDGGRVVFASKLRPDGRIEFLHIWESK